MKTNTPFSKNITSNIFCLFRFMNLNLRLNFIKVILISFLSSFFDVLNILAIGPFIAVIVNSERSISYYSNNLIFKYFFHFSLLEPEIIFIIIFALTTIFSAVSRLWLIRVNSSFAYQFGGSLANEMFMKVLCQPFNFFISNSYNSISTTLTQKISLLITELFIPLIAMLGAFISMFFIIGTLLLTNFIATISAFLTFGAFYILTVSITKFKLRKYSQDVSHLSSKINMNITDALSGIREIILGESQNSFASTFNKNQNSLRNSQAKITFIANFPRYIIECISLLAISLVALLSLMSNDDLPGAVTLLGIMIFSVQKMLPQIHALYNGWTMSASNNDLVLDVLALLRLNEKQLNSNNEERILNFSHEITLRNLCFNYPNTPLILKNLNLSIKKGSKIVIIGKSGCGKSTLLDVLSGLLQPSSGKIFIDSKTLTRKNENLWFKKIAFVPQSIFIADLSILENIAFGSTDIDLERIHNAIDKAQISEFINSLPLKLNTKIGDSGVNISGGQRQRIGIARAFYKKPELIILDEPTSSLDFETEKNFISFLNSLDKNITIILITHRLRKSLNFDAIYELSSEGLNEKS